MVELPQWLKPGTFVTYRITHTGRWPFVWYAGVPADFEKYEISSVSETDKVAIILKKTHSENYDSRGLPFSARLTHNTATSH